MMSFSQAIGLNQDKIIPKRSVPINLTWETLLGCQSGCKQMKRWTYRIKP
jgi:hypothetical protein